MAQELGTGYIIISPSTKGLGRAIEGSIGDGTASGVAKSGKTILSSVGGAFKTVGKIGVGAVGTVTGAIVGLAAKGGIDRALNIERAQTKLKALGHDTKSVDGIMSDALKSVKGTAYGLGDAASVAAGLVASGIKQGSELSGVLATVGDVAQVSGRSFSDMGLIFQQVAAKGKLQGDEMLQLMQSGIPVLQYLADHFGITAEEAQKMVSDGKVSFKDFEAAMREHLGGAAQSAGESFDGAMANVKAALSRLGETIATPVIKGLTGLFNQGIPLIDDFAARAKPALESVGTALGEGLEQAIPATAGALELLRAPLQWFLDNGPAIGTAFAAIATGIATLKTAAFISSTASMLKDFGAALELAGEVAAKNGGFLNSLADSIQLMGRSGNTFTRFIGSASGALGQLLTAAGKAGGGLTGLSKALGLGKWGLIAGAVAAVASALVVFFTQTETGRTAWKKLTGFLSSAWDAVQSAWQAVLPTLQSLVDNALGAIGNVIESLQPFIGELGGWLSGLLSPITSNLPALQEAFGQLVRAAGDAATAIMPAIMQLGDSFMQLLPALAQVIPVVMQLVSTLASALVPAITPIVQMLATIIPPIMELAVTLMGALMPAIGLIVGALAAFLPVVLQLATTLVGMLVPVITAIVQAVTALLPVVTTVITSILAVVQPVITALVGVIQGVVTVLQGVITFLQGVFTGNWSQAWEGVKQIFSGVWQAITSVFTGIWEALKAAITGGLNIIGSVWNATWNAVRTVFSTIWDGIRNAARAGVDGLTGIISGIKDRILGFFSGAGSWLLDSGHKIVQGLIDGITGMIGAAGDAISGVMGRIRDFLPFSPAKRGPFSGRGWTPYSGQALVSGLAQGIRNGLPDAEREMGRVMGAVAGRVAGATLPSIPLRVTGVDLGAAAFDALLAAGIDPASAANAGKPDVQRSTTYNVTIDARRVEADSRMAALIDALVESAGVTVRARA